MSKADVLANLVSTGGILADGAITPAKISALHTDGGTMNGAISFANTQTWPTFNQSTTGNAATANKWTTARTLSLAGDATGNVSLDGSADATLTVAVADDSHNHTSSSGNFSVGGNLSVTGNLTINGTTTTINSTVTTVDDPIMTLGGDTSPASDDNKDRGIEFRWHNGSAAKTGFFGFDDSTGYMMFIPDATNTSEVFSGTLGDIQATNFRGALFGNANTATTLATARTINGVSFNGSADITVADSTKLPLAGGTMTGAISFTAGQTWPTFNQNTTGSASSAPLLSALNNYVWSQSTLPTSYNSGIQCAFVGPAAGEGSWQNYGSVMTMRTYSGGGGSLQLYTPYGPGNGGTGLQVRFGNYDVSSGNAWTAWKTLLASDNYTNYSPTLTGTGASGTWGISVTGNAATATNATNSTYVASPDGDRVAGNKLPTTNPRTVRFDFATAGSVTGAAGNYAGVMTYAPWDGTSASTGDSSYQLAFTNQSGVNASGPPQLLLRNGINSTWNSWNTILSSSNYTNFATARVSANRPGVTKLYRSDDDTAYNIQTHWSPDVSGYWSLRGYLNDSYHAPCYVALSGRSNRANGNFYIDDNYGNTVVGVYASTRYQGVYAMGDAYKMAADGASLANMYGIAWSHPNAGGAAGNLTDHGMLIINNGGFRCAISNSIVASGNITAYSDERLKTNWRDMPDNYVSRLAKVKVGIYDRLDAENGTQVGVSAQSLQTILPEAITTAKDDMQTLSVNYGGAALASAVELAKDNCELRARIERLEALIHTMIHKE